MHGQYRHGRGYSSRNSRHEVRFPLSFVYLSGCSVVQHTGRKYTLGSGTYLRVDLFRSQVKDRALLTFSLNLSFVQEHSQCLCVAEVGSLAAIDLHGRGAERQDIIVIIGLGRIGREVAKRMQSFNMKVVHRRNYS